jgi:DNA primase
MNPKSPDLVQLVATYIPLSPSRRTLRGNCPFHPDTAGSFMVSPEKQLFKCFGCGQEGGIPEFKLAIEKLARA